MGESSIHMRLVELLANWVSESFLDGDSGFMLIDDRNANSQTKPPIIYNYIPDVYVPYNSKCQLIIGEAKTSNDIEKEHTVEQLRAFLRKCGEFDNSIFVLAVPWHMERLAKSIVSYVKADVGAINVATKVLEKLPG